MFTGYPVHTRVERHGNHRNRAAPRTASSLVFTSKGISNPDQTTEARDVNISGVDFWHAVEFSRNGRFLRTAFRQALRASFFRVSSLSDAFRSVFRSFIHPISRTGRDRFRDVHHFSSFRVSPEIHTHLVGGNANEPIFMGTRVRVGRAEWMAAPATRSTLGHSDGVVKRRGPDLSRSGP